MSENLISEKENAEANTTAPAESKTTEDATIPAEGAPTAAVVKIEGQEFPLDVAIAKDDELLKGALSPHYPSIRNAQISRETRAGQMIVSIVKRAEHKGNRGKRVIA